MRGRLLRLELGLASLREHNERQKAAARDRRTRFLHDLHVAYGDKGVPAAVDGELELTEAEAEALLDDLFGPPPVVN